MISASFTNKKRRFQARNSDSYYCKTYYCYRYFNLSTSETAVSREGRQQALRALASVGEAFYSEWQRLSCAARILEKIESASHRVVEGCRQPIGSREGWGMEPYLVAPRAFSAPNVRVMKAVSHHRRKKFMKVAPAITVPGAGGCARGWHATRGWTARDTDCTINICRYSRRDTAFVP